MADKFEVSSKDTIKNQYDLIIIGSGGAGLVTAVQAYELGLSPVILEKMERIGGNTGRASTGMNAAESLVQVKNKIIDTYSDFYEETFVGGGKKNNPAMLKFFSEHAALGVDWLKEHDVVLTDLTTTGGMSVPRAHRPGSTAPIGAYLIKGLLEKISEYEIPVFNNMAVENIEKDDNRYTVETADTKINAPAIVLTSGGFGANVELISKVRPELKEYKTTNQPGTMGDGLKLAENLNAEIINLSDIQVHPTVQQDTDHTYLIGETVRGEGAILVNKSGKRFVNELDTRKEVTRAIDELKENGAYLVLDQTVFDRVQALGFYQSIGLVTSADSIEELAHEIDVDSDNLEKTIDKWNRAIQAKKDSEFHRTTGMQHKIKKPKFYAIHIAPAVHYTMGGVKINELTQVIDKEDNVIPGFFAAGEVTGGLHGNNRIGGNSIAETVVFGRQAAQQAYKYLK
ncbi:flavocytochrome c [Companilactobacillus metriopterae]|uniref:flavocytochrome c n=1 Tax=Companilactobacillus metriopterae TaxID=1909267 RepID=UPI00100A6CAD|nr:flavocytochrome c [Companilactobacillus metriopterae]